MKTRVQRWGNSLAVRIPKSFAQEVGLVEDSPVEMRLVDGALVLEPVTEIPLTLVELLDGVNDDNLHGELDTGAPEGREAW